MCTSLPHSRRFLMLAHMIELCLVSAMSYLFLMTTAAAAATKNAAPSIAVVKVGGAVITEELDTLAENLIALRSAGLFPVVIHGGGPQLNVRLQEAGIEPVYEQVWGDFRVQYVAGAR